MTTVPHSELLDAMSVVRFQRSLLSVLDQHKREAERCADLEDRLARAEAQEKQDAEAAGTVRAQVRAAENRAQEAEATVAAQKKSAEDERSRHALQLSLLEDQIAKLQQALKGKGQRVHELEERLRERETECSSRRAFQESAEGLIESFQSRLQEVSSMLEAVSQSEHMCREALEALRVEQAAQRAQVDQCKGIQKKAISRSQFEDRLKAAQNAATRADALAARRLEALRLACARLDEARSAHSQTCDIMKKLQVSVQHEASQGRSKAKLLSASNDHLNKVLQRNLKLTECNERLIGEALRKEAQTQLILRELSRADAAVHAAQEYSSMRKNAVDRETARLNSRIGEITDQLLATQMHSVEEAEKAQKKIAELEGRMLELASTNASVGTKRPRHSSDSFIADNVSELVSAKQSQGHDDAAEQSKTQGLPAGPLDLAAQLPSVPSELAVPELLDDDADDARIVAGPSGVASSSDHGELASRQEPIQQPEVDQRASDTPFPSELHAESAPTSSTCDERANAATAQAPPKVFRAEEPNAVLAPSSVAPTAGSSMADAVDIDAPAPPVCAKCKDVLFGVTVSCSKCAVRFHAQCCQRSSSNLQKPYICSDCAPPSRSQKRSRSAKSIGNLLQQSSLLS